MGTRRDVFKIFAAASVALPSAAVAQQTGEVETQPGHLHEGSTVKLPHPSQPNFFQPEEFHTMEALCERIIPRSDTPGAKDAGVALLIDKAIVANEALSPRFRAGLADLNAISINSYAQTFVNLSEEQQIAILTPMSLEVDSPMGQFFTLVKDMTIDAYYKTEAGLKTELGWHGNTYLASFPGCQHPEHQG